MLKNILIVIILLVILAFGGVLAYRIYNSSQVEGLSLSNISLYNLRTGNNITLRQIIDNQITLIYFTSTSCPVCVKQRKMFSNLPTSQRKMIQWLDVVSNASGITEWMSKYGALHDWVTLDVDRNFSKALRLTATPTIILVNRDNKIIYYHRGYLSRSQWNKELYPTVLNSEFDV